MTVCRRGNGVGNRLWHHSVIIQDVFSLIYRSFIVVRDFSDKYPSPGPTSTQGCSTLWNAEEVEEAIEAANGGSEAVLGERASAVGLEDVEGEAAEPCEDAGVDADARAILAHGDITAVVGGVLD